MKQEGRSYQTQLALGNALKKRLAASSLNEIRVADLTADCHLHRKTFYYHFSDLFELFRWVVLDDARKEKILEPSERNYRKILCKCAEMISGSNFYKRCLQSPEGSMQMKKAVSEIIYHHVCEIIVNLEKEKNTSIRQEYREFLVIVYATAIAEIFVEFARGKIQMTPSAFAEYLYTTIEAALYASIIKNPMPSI